MVAKSVELTVALSGPLLVEMMDCWKAELKAVLMVEKMAA
jgi:hypothetical protein